MLIRMSKLSKERPLELLLPANLNHKVDRRLQEENPHQHHQEANLDPHHLNRLREVSPDLHHLVDSHQQEVASLDLLHLDPHLLAVNLDLHHQEANLDLHHLNRLQEVNPHLHLLHNLSHLDKSLLKLAQISPQLVALSLRQLLK